MLSVSVGEAKNRLPYFLHLVEEENEEIQITRHGKPVAFINGKIPYKSLKKSRSILMGLKPGEINIQTVFYRTQKLLQFFRNRSFR